MTPNEALLFTVKVTSAAGLVTQNDRTSATAMMFIFMIFCWGYLLLLFFRPAHDPALPEPPGYFISVITRMRDALDMVRMLEKKLLLTLLTQKFPLVQFHKIKSIADPWTF